MPEFSNPFTVLNADRKLTRGELIRAIRYNIAAEYEAIQLYMQLHDSIDDEFVKKVLVDIANEEKEHAGEFMRVLKHINPEEFEHYKEGEEEVEEMLKSMNENK